MHGREASAAPRGESQQIQMLGCLHGNRLRVRPQRPCSIFMFVEPMTGWMRPDVLRHRTKVDWAHQMKKLIDEDYPEAEKIVLVMDNLNTHNIASFYDAFKPEEVRRLVSKLETHSTPEHGSWLDITEIAL